MYRAGQGSGVNSRGLVGAMAAFGLVGAGSVGLAVGTAAPAEAFAGTCPATTPAAVLVADGVCEVRITTVGASTFNPPSGITKLAAVLVGAGGGGWSEDTEAYAGNGGAVVYVDSVPLTGPISVNVGAGGAAATIGDPTTAGADTIIVVGATPFTASGGDAAAFSGSNFCITDDNLLHSGDGDGGANAASGSPDCLPGAGAGLADLSGTDPALFPASADGTDVYGGGGTASANDPLAVGLAGSGGSASGGGVPSPGTNLPSAAVAGAGGLVIFRFAVDAPSPTPSPSVSPSLAATGAVVSWEVPAISAGMIGIGALLFVLFRRRRGQATGR